MDVTDLPVIDKFKHELLPGMECRGKGILLVIWWPAKGLHCVLPHKDGTPGNVRIAVDMMIEAARHQAF